MFEWLRTLYQFNDTTYEEYYLTDISRLTDALSSFALYVTIGIIGVLLLSFFILRASNIKFTSAISVIP